MTTNDAREIFEGLFSNVQEAEAFEAQVLSSGSEFLPGFIRAVRDGGEATVDYYLWLAEQTGSDEGDGLEEVLAERMVWDDIAAWKAEGSLKAIVRGVMMGSEEDAECEWESVEIRKLASILFGVTSVSIQAVRDAYSDLMVRALRSIEVAS